MSKLAKFQIIILHLAWLGVRCPLAELHVPEFDETYITGISTVRYKHENHPANPEAGSVRTALRAYAYTVWYSHLHPKVLHPKVHRALKGLGTGAFCRFFKSLEVFRRKSIFEGPERGPAAGFLLGRDTCRSLSRWVSSTCRT